MGIVGAAVGAAGSIIGGISASRAMKKIKANLQQQMKENQNWYDQRYNEDATQRADAQALLTRTEEAIKARNAQAAGAQAVMGGNEESVAAAKAANNQALADATANIAVNADKRKDAIESQYMSTKASLNDSLNKLEQQKAEAIGKAAQGVADAAGKLNGLGSIGGMPL